LVEGLPALAAGPRASALADAQTVLDDFRSALSAAEARLDYLERQVSQAVQRQPQLALLVALQLLRGVGELTAATIVAEVGDFRRFAQASSFMNYTGLTSGLSAPARLMVIRCV
jgi:transposase